MISVKQNHMVKLSGVVFCMMIVLLSASIALAEVTCTATVDRTSVPVGGYVVLTVTAEGTVDKYTDFQLPTITGVAIGNGMTSSRRMNINGRISNTESRAFYLYVENQENFIIPSIKVTAGAESAQSQPINITVTAADQTGGIPPATSGNRVRQPQIPSTSGTSSKNKDIFVTLEVDTDSVWVGQQIVLSFKYWHRGQSWSDPSYQPPKTEGFWRENLGPERNFRESYNGWVYNVTEIKYALFPTRSGTLNIEPAVLSFSGSSGRFFGSRRRTQAPKSYRTETLTIDVKPLPTPRPVGFSGLAGKNLELSAQVNRPDVPMGDAVTYTIEIMTDGFLKGFAGLDVVAPEGCRLHDGAEQMETLLGRRNQVGDQQLIGRFSQESFFVPGKTGLLEIPQLDVSWFNVVTGKYQTARTSIQRVNVTQGRAASGENEASGFMRSEIERLGQDLAFIRQAPDDIAMWSPALTKTPKYWIGLLFPLVALLIWRLYVNKIASERRDPAVVRRRQALSVALAEIKRSEQLAASEDRFGVIAHALTGYVAHMLDRPIASIGVPEIRGFSESLGHDDLGLQLADFLQVSNSARYGGGSHTLDTAPVEVRTWLTELDVAYKRKSAGRKNNAVAGKALSILVFSCLALANAVSVEAADGQVERPGADPVRLLAEGNHAYTAGDIPLAMDLYSQAVESGADDPILYYNLGNAHARQGQLGKAIVSYLRARRLSPLDKDVNGNLLWIRSQLKDLELQDSSLPLFIAEVVTIIGWLTLGQWSLVPLFLVWLLALQVGWVWYREGASIYLRRMLLGTLALLIISSGISGWRYYLEEIRNQAVIIVAEAPVHSGPSDSYPVLFEIHDGLTVNLSEYRDGWVRMDLGGQWQGWVPATSIEPVRQSRH